MDQLACVVVVQCAANRAHVIACANCTAILGGPLDWLSAGGAAVRLAESAEARATRGEQCDEQEDGIYN